MRKLKNIDLDDLVEKGVIEATTAEKIQHYYQSKKANTPGRLSLAFGILGAILIGLGIILIIAHNWDTLNLSAKTVLAFIPMLLGQVACGYTLLKKSKSATWRESSTTFLFFAVGACIAMISQIYHIDGELGSFLLTWMLLCLPLIYVMQSSIVSLLYIGGITWYAINCGYVQNHEPYLFWALLAMVLPHYYQLYKKRPVSNAFNFHSWALAISVLITLGLWHLEVPIWMWVAYASLLSLYFLIGSQAFFRNKSWISNPFLMIGVVGTVGFFLFFTFRENWDGVLRTSTSWQMLDSQEFWVSVLLIGACLYLLYQLDPFQNYPKIAPIAFGFMVFLPIFFLGHRSPTVGMVLSNLFVLATGIFFIYQGNYLNDLGILNVGLLVLTALIIGRFFDLDLTFVTRGILFVLVGIGFFVANYQLIRKRNKFGEEE